MAWPVTEPLSYQINVAPASNCFPAIATAFVWHKAVVRAIARQNALENLPLDDPRRGEWRDEPDPLPSPGQGNGNGQDDDTAS